MQDLDLNQLFVSGLFSYMKCGAGAAPADAGANDPFGPGPDLDQTNGLIAN